MPTLHTLNKTAQNSLLNETISNIIDKDDSVILIEDGVYQCIKLFSEQDPDKQENSWPQRAKSVYALKEDALARGIQSNTKGITFVSYEEFVRLSLAYNKLISWY